MKTALVLRTCTKDMRGICSQSAAFVWPESGPVEAPDWDPKPECGGGLHFCINPAGCDDFRDGVEDRYVACLVDPKDIVVHPNPKYPDKIKVKKCKVLYECDREGIKIKTQSAVPASKAES